VKDRLSQFDIDNLAVRLLPIDSISYLQQFIIHHWPFNKNKSEFTLTYNITTIMFPLIRVIDKSRLDEKDSKMNNPGVIM
jgi:hypothetical protein